MALIVDGRKIEAIKLYRDMTGAGLKEAKDAVESLERDGSAPKPPPSSGGHADVLELLRAPQKIGAFMLPCIPVTWKSGSAASTVLPLEAWFQVAPPATLAITVRCECMQPLGSPVVPEVYGSTDRSSGPTSNGPGSPPADIASSQSVTPGSVIISRGAATTSGNGTPSGSPR